MRRTCGALLVAATAAAAGCGGDDDGATDDLAVPASAAPDAPSDGAPPIHAIAWISSRSAGATRTRDGLDTPLEPGEIRMGDVVRLPEQGRAAVDFDDGGKLWLVGPLAISFGEMSAGGRHVMLAEGSISRAKAGKVALEIQTPGDIPLVLQNCEATVTVAKGDKVEFRRLGPGYAKLWRPAEQRFEDLGDDGLVVGLSKPAGK